MRVVIGLEGGSVPEEAETVRIVPVGLHSYLEANDVGGWIMKTVDHETISTPATMSDVSSYRLIADSLG